MNPSLTDQQIEALRVFCMRSSLTIEGAQNQWYMITNSEGYFQLGTVGGPVLAVSARTAKSYGEGSFFMFSTNMWAEVYFEPTDRSQPSVVVVSWGRE